MEKTIQIVIASTTFVCTEGAYEKLSSYLKRMEEHFHNENEREEIMRDIESRIAEKLLEKKHVLISLSQVMNVIEEIGEVSELEDDMSMQATETSSEKMQRQLYRNMDTALIAGVASGIATYFNANILLIRSLFVISIFFGGTGIFVYILLWIFIPEAKTTTQKLEMRGEPVTFDTISSLVRTKTAEAKNKRIFAGISHLVRSLLTKIFSGASRIIGLFLALFSFIGMIGLTIFFGVVLTNWNTPYNDIPFREAFSETLLLIASAAGYLTVLIPLFLVCTLGYRMVRRRTAIPSGIGFALLAIWSLALITTAVSGFKMAGDYYTYTTTNPEFVATSKNIELEPFSHIVANGVRVTIANSDAPYAVVTGPNATIDDIKIAVKDDTVTIDAVENEKSCFFCDKSLPTVTIYSPTTTVVEVNKSSVSFEKFIGNTLHLIINHGNAEGLLTVNDLTVTAKEASVHAEIQAESLTLEGVGSSFYLSGSVTNANLSLLQRTSLQGESLIIENANIEAINSYTELIVRGTLTKTTDAGSAVHVRGQMKNEMEESI